MKGRAWEGLKRRGVGAEGEGVGVGEEHEGEGMGGVEEEGCGG